MSLWLRTRHATWLASALGLIVVTGVAVGERSVRVPGVFGLAGGDLLIASLLPMIWAGAVANTWAASRQGVECRPSRRLAQVDALAFVVVSGLAAGAFSAVLGSTGDKLAGVGAMLVASGIAAGVTIRRGSGAAALGVAVMILFTATYSIAAPGARFVRVFQADGDLVWSLVCGLAAVAVAATALATHRVVHRLGRDEYGE